MSIRNFELEQEEIWNMKKQGLFAEMQDFIDRNKIQVELQNRYSIESFCVRCLKAHLLVKAEQAGMEEELISNFLGRWDGEIGHQGYYLDNDEVVRIN